MGCTCTGTASAHTLCAQLNESCANAFQVSHVTRHLSILYRPFSITMWSNVRSAGFIRCVALILRDRSDEIATSTKMYRFSIHIHTHTNTQTQTHDYSMRSMLCMHCVFADFSSDSMRGAYRSWLSPNLSSVTHPILAALDADYLGERKQFAFQLYRWKT